MKAKHKRKAINRALQQELKPNTKKTSLRRQPSQEHQVFDGPDN